MTPSIYLCNRGGISTSTFLFIFFLAIIMSLDSVISFLLLSCDIAFFKDHFMYHLSSFFLLLTFKVDGRPSGGA